MARKLDIGIEFDSPATVAELLEALEDLRARVSGDGIVRVRGFIEIHSRGPRVKAISAERPTTGAVTK